ncbi:hypothetical protein DXG03_000878, partial [Asterophora parasitica]
ERPTSHNAEEHATNIYRAKDEHRPGFTNMFKGKGGRTDKEGRSEYVDGTFVDYKVHMDTLLLQSQSLKDDRILPDTQFLLNLARSQAHGLGRPLIVGPTEKTLSMMEFWASDLISELLVLQGRTMLRFPSVTFLFESLMDSTESLGKMILGRAPVSDSNGDWNRVSLVSDQGSSDWVIPSPSKRINNIIYPDEYGAEHGMAIDTGM